MKRIILLVAILFFTNVMFAEVKYTSEITTNVAPSLTFTAGDNLYLSWVDKNGVIHIGKGVLRTTGGQVVKIIKDIDIGSKTPNHPDLAFHGENILLGWNEPNGKVYLALYNTDLERKSKFEYNPSANNAISVAPSFKKLIVNTWTSKNKPGLTLIATLPTGGDYCETLCDLRYSEYLPKGGSSIATMEGKALVVWRGDKNEVHLTNFKLQYIELTKKFDVVIHTDYAFDFKTEIDPACAFGADGKLYITWYNKGQDLIECGLFDISSETPVSVDHKNFTADGCKGIDICFYDGNPYIAYTNKDGIIVVAKIM
ncbi:MAG: hypothetical protein ACUVWP_09010 [bacterium]